MKIFKIAALTVASCFLVAQAAHLFEDFEGYDVGEDLFDFYWWSDTTSPVAYGVTVDEFTVSGITTKAVFFNLKGEDQDGDSNLDPSAGEWIYFEAVTQPAGPSPLWMQFDAAIAVNEAIRDATENAANPSLVAEVWYYFFADTDGDGDPDVYYETFVTDPSDPGSPLNSAGVLQPYPRRYLFGENADVWDQLDIDTFDFLGDTVGVPISDTRNITEFGMQFRMVESFETAGQTDYFTIWVDNVTLIPEPGTMALALGATALLALRRRRR